MTQLHTIEVLECKTTYHLGEMEVIYLVVDFYLVIMGCVFHESNFNRLVHK